MGTGVADSIWVDLGMPVRSTTDGKLYKPLFAILCTELDGRLNLNAHGCVAQAQGSLKLTNASGTPIWSYYGVGGASNVNLLAEYPIYATQKVYGTAGVLSYLFSNSTPAAAQLLRSLPRGQGYGPAEISLAPVLGLGGAGSAYMNLLCGYVNTTVSGGGSITSSCEGRYGERALEPSVRQQHASRGWRSPLPGITGQLGSLLANKWFEYKGTRSFNTTGPTMGSWANGWLSYWDTPNWKSAITSGIAPGWYSSPVLNSAGSSIVGYNLDSYGTPPDLLGAGAIGVDPTGNALYCGMGSSFLGNYYGDPGVSNATVNPGSFAPTASPYELNLMGQAAWQTLPANATFEAGGVAGATAGENIDNPFRPTELEALLRPFDVDAAALPQRIAQLAANTNLSMANFRNELTTEQWDLPCPAVKLNLDSDVVALPIYPTVAASPPARS